MKFILDEMNIYIFIKKKTIELFIVILIVKNY